VDLVLEPSSLKWLLARAKLLKVKREGKSFSDLFERLIDGVNSLETLKKLRGCVELKDKEVLLKEVYAARAERRL
jgi:predicted CopG family antitoxin